MSVAVAAVPLVSAGAMGQPTGRSPLTPPENGPRRTDPGFHALINAVVHRSPDESYSEGAVIIRDGRIAAVVDTHARDWAPPAGARVWDCAGLHLYPAFVEPYAEVEAPTPETGSPGSHWNGLVTPQRSALDGPGLDEGAAESFRKLGYGTAVISPSGGIFRGRASAVSLARAGDNPASDRPEVYRRGVYQAWAFETARGDNSARWTGYPDSVMGSIALSRQTFFDADWLSERATAAADSATLTIDPEAPAGCLAELADHRVPLLFDARDELHALRAAGVAREAGRRMILLGSGFEFRRLAAIAEDGNAVIVPLNFPAAPDVSSVGAAESVELADMMAWEQAPTGPRRLAAEVPIALTTARLRDRSEFWANLEAAMRHGLTADQALAGLTTGPASLLGLSSEVGELAPGLRANIIVADGDLFAVDRPGRPAGNARPAGDAKPGSDDKKDAKIRDLWIDGLRHEINAADPPSLAGVWDATVAVDQHLTIEIAKGDAVTVKRGDTSVKAASVRAERGRLSFVFDHSDFQAGTSRFIMTAVVRGDTMTGTGLRSDGTAFQWSAARTGPAPEAPEKKDDQPAGDDAGADGPAGEQPDAAQADAEQADAEQADAEQADAEQADAQQPDDGAEETDPTADIPERYGYPFGPYAVLDIPAQRSVIVRNAVVWTSGPAGVIDRGAIGFSNGRIDFVAADDGRSFDADVIIDAGGRHVTPGLIDAHSHTGLFRGGVNEGGQAVTAECRIHDALDPGDINFYRQLACGVTTVNSLHGSANAIGGQNAVHKVRWGARRPGDMLVAGAPAGIKFALGENPRAVNWGPGNDWRYPQTRMGVETLIRDRFAAAKEYAAARSAGDRGVRRDLELDALAEVVSGERLIHCHSYRQDEILMLCRLAEEYGITIGTFQHVLEGYKVAEAIRGRALGASAFSDWWAYKVEVQDAIPYNGAIMHDQGVVVSFNSDSDELARRMNTEAAKATRYGGVPPEEALKFVTLNPARQLAIDDRVGSLEPGKDADVVLWSGPPMSTLSRCDAVWVDGREAFSAERDAASRAEIRADRERLIQKILRADKPSAAGGGGGPPRGRPGRPTNPRWAAYDLSDAVREHALDLIRRGLDPAAAACGDCGCSHLGVASGMGGDR